MSNLSRLPSILALVASLLGALFAGISTLDYVKHLDRQLHVVHCSFIPGVADAAAADNACRTAMYSSFGAVFRGTWWGGIPISLLGLGVYIFFIAFSLALVVGGSRASRKAYQFLGYAGLLPLLASVVMAYVAAVELGIFCKTCAGMYVASVLLAAAGIWGMLQLKRFSVTWQPSTAPSPTGASGAYGNHVVPVNDMPAGAMPLGKWWAVVVWLAALGMCVGVPALAYVTTLPDYRPMLGSCGTIAQPKSKALLTLATKTPKREAILVSDPLCPTCKGLHERLVSEGIFDNLLPSLVLMPLDNSCNWMLDRSLHPGSCLLSKVVICSEGRARDTLEWIYHHQEMLTAFGKAGDNVLRERLRAQFGQGLDACLDAKQTELKLNNMLQYAVTNELPVSTPQLFLGNLRVCDEDTDLGLRYTMSQLAPEVL